MEYTAEVKINYKPGILDADGKTVAKALHMLGFNDIKKVTSVKTYSLTVEDNSPEGARRQVEEACRKLLANPVVQTYAIEFKE